MVNTIRTPIFVVCIDRDGVGAVAGCSHMHSMRADILLKLAFSNR
jgi:hypothetical protein